MPPHLRHGVPVQQRSTRTAQPLHLCTCWQCFNQTAVDPTNSQVVHGAYVSLNVYRQHLSEEANCGIAPPLSPNTVVSLHSLVLPTVAHSLQRAPEAGFPAKQPPPCSHATNSDEPDPKEPSPTYSNLHGMEPHISIPLLLVATAHLLCQLSIDHCSFILACLQATITATARAAISTASSFDPTSLSKTIPSDVRTVVDQLDLTPVTRSFVCCLKCFTCHPITQDASYPDHCTHQETPSSSRCNHPLRKTKFIKGRQKSFPARRLLVHSLQDWISKLLNQPELERYMDEYPTTRETSKNIDDIWGAKGLRDLKGPDGKRFVIKGGKEGRYVFSICFDGLNYDGNKHGG